MASLLPNHAISNRLGAARARVGRAYVNGGQPSVSDQVEHVTALVIDLLKYRTASMPERREAIIAEIAEELLP